MLWAALLPAATDPRTPPTSPASPTDPGLPTWCLQFTPRVALVDEAVVMEVEASLRLFGGRRKLALRVNEEAAELGVIQVSWAPTSLAALALARHGVANGFAKPLEELLDALPLTTLRAVAAHQPTLARLGCQTLGDVRALPRGGMARRFDVQLLEALDQAYGLRPEAHAWFGLPEAFSAKLELMARVELAPALLFGARRLVVLMCGWLAARQSGITAFRLRWWHDAMRPRSAGEGGELVVRTAEPTRQLEHLCRLLAELLAKVELEAPVGDIALEALDVRTIDARSLSLLPDERQSGESLGLVLERVAARLGPERVQRPVLREDHRLEWMCHWQPASLALPARRANAPRMVDMPQPTFLLPAPLKLATRANRPLYQGLLQLLTGPHRVEGGWWDRTMEEGEARTRNVVRDYWVALSEHAGLLWIFQTRLANDETAWFLHGSFA